MKKRLRMNKKTILFSGILLILLAFNTPAAPGMPHLIHGTIEYPDGSHPTTITITLEINSQTIAYPGCPGCEYNPKTGEYALTLQPEINVIPGNQGIVTIDDGNNTTRRLIIITQAASSKVSNEEPPTTTTTSTTSTTSTSTTSTTLASSSGGGSIRGSSYNVNYAKPKATIETTSTVPTSTTIKETTTTKLTTTTVKATTTSTEPPTTIPPQPRPTTTIQELSGGDTPTGLAIGLESHTTQLGAILTLGLVIGAAYITKKKYLP
ncbi:MAG: hypothetical protein GF334_13510 [Candidatus Altiarchaeales archaeon]|nr:hypothetical protein [Candidatus Altiarchaeales archaeon]